MADSYSDLLRDPRWQRKRLEVMQRADFKCEACGATDQTLNVHHERYVRGRMPWEYPDSELHCLCEKCHRSEHGIKTVQEKREAASLERARARQAEWKAAHPEAAVLLDRLAEIDRLLPYRTDDEKDALIGEKQNLTRTVAPLLPRMWRKLP